MTKDSAIKQISGKAFKASRNNFKVKEMGRETGVSKEAISQGISADLPMLHPTSTSGFSNILDFEEKMSFYLKREFGPIGKN